MQLLLDSRKPVCSIHPFHNSSDKEQADKLTEYLGARSSGNDKGVQISTVDAFQGGEKEIIVLSTVRTMNSGFMDNNARINVALTRAKRHLFILGKQELLINNHLWCNILNHCQGNWIIQRHQNPLLKFLLRR